MVRHTPATLSALYEADETAWLEAMSELASLGRADALDLVNLAEYLQSMARRDYRELKSRLVLFLMHMLKWIHQPDKRTGSWRVTIREQRRQLMDLIDSGTLKNHAEAILDACYAEALDDASDETGLPRDTFPTANPFSILQWLAQDIDVA